MNLNDICERALARPEVYVPVLRDEIERLYTKLEALPATKEYDPELATLKAKLSLFYKDADSWGSNLNEAAWVLDELYRAQAGSDVSQKFLNNLKSVLRRCILSYLDGVNRNAK